MHIRPNRTLHFSIPDQMPITFRKATDMQSAATFADKLSLPIR
ncbi:hypothetical protein [Pasteurella testudinis]|nr:hypothetical protein [Pasteurella testudinis]